MNINYEKIERLKWTCNYIGKHFEENELKLEWLSSIQGYDELVETFSDLSFVDNFDGIHEAYRRLHVDNLNLDKVITFGTKCFVDEQS